MNTEKTYEEILMVETSEEGEYLLLYFYVYVKTDKCFFIMDPYNLNNIKDAGELFKLKFEDYWRTKGNTIIFDSIIGVYTLEKYKLNSITSEDRSKIEYQNYNEDEFGIQIQISAHNKKDYCAEFKILESEDLMLKAYHLQALVNYGFPELDDNYDYHIYMKPINTEGAWKYSDTLIDDYMGNIRILQLYGKDL
ncbi:28711_t:CDS:2, partial [Gigaspora margarita]